MENTIMKTNGKVELNKGGMSDSDIVLPRAIILHEQKGDLKAGTMINNITGGVISGHFIPLLVYKNYVKFNEDFGAEWLTSDRNDPRVIEGLQWKKSPANSKKFLRREVTEFMNFLCVFNEDLSFPVVLSFKNSSMSEGKRLYTTCRIYCGTAIFPGVGIMYFVKPHRFEIGVSTNQNGPKTYWNPMFRIPQEVKKFKITDAKDGFLADLAEVTKTAASIVSSLTVSQYGAAAVKESAPDF